MYWEPDKECMDREELEQLQLERLQSTLNRVYAHVPFYRKKFDALGISPEEIGSLSDLSRLPFTTKEDVRGNYPYGLFAVPLREVVRIHASSGTTETSSVVGYTRNDIDHVEQAGGPHPRRRRGDEGRRRPGLVPLRAVHGGVRAALRRGAARRLGDPGVQRQHRPPDPDHEGLQDDGAGLHPFLRDAGRRHDPGDGDPRLGALPQVRPLRRGAVVREDAARRSRTPSGSSPRTITDSRRSSGRGSPASASSATACTSTRTTSSSRSSTRRRFRPVPPGQTGELVITTLTKEAFPMIRYRTRDLTSLLAGNCPCGRTGRRMSRLAGRTDEMLIIRGMKVSPSKIESLLFEIEGNEPNYRIVIDRKGAMDEVTVLVEAAGEAPFGEERRHVGRTVETIRKRLTHELGVTVDVKLVEKEALETVGRKAEARHRQPEAVGDRYELRHAVRRGDAAGEPGGHHLPRRARPQGGAGDRLRGHAPHGEAAEPLRDPHADGRLPRIQQGAGGGGDPPPPPRRGERGARLRRRHARHLGPGIRPGPGRRRRGDPRGGDPRSVGPGGRPGGLRPAHRPLRLRGLSPEPRGAAPQGARGPFPRDADDDLLRIPAPARLVPRGRLGRARRAAGLRRAGVDEGARGDRPGDAAGAVGGDRRAVERPRRGHRGGGRSKEDGGAVGGRDRPGRRSRIASGSSRDLAKEIAERTGLSRKEVYEEILRQRK